MTLAYISHPDCLRHEMGAHHPESPARLRAIEDRLSAAGVLDQRATPLDNVIDVHIARLRKKLVRGGRRACGRVQSWSPHNRVCPATIVVYCIQTRHRSADQLEGA